MNTPLKAIIVEDEEASRTTLNNYLIKYCKGVNVVAMADSVKTGLAAINCITPMLFF